MTYWTIKCTYMNTNFIIYKRMPGIFFLNLRVSYPHRDEFLVWHIRERHWNYHFTAKCTETLLLLYKHPEHVAISRKLDVLNHSTSFFHPHDQIYETQKHNSANSRIYRYYKHGPLWYARQGIMAPWIWSCTCNRLCVSRSHCNSNLNSINMVIHRWGDSSLLHILWFTQGPQDYEESDYNHCLANVTNKTKSKKKHKVLD